MSRDINRHGMKHSSSHSVVAFPNRFPSRASAICRRGCHSNKIITSEETEVIKIDILTGGERVEVDTPRCILHVRPCLPVCVPSRGSLWSLGKMKRTDTWYPRRYSSDEDQASLSFYHARSVDFNPTRPKRNFLFDDFLTSTNLFILKEAKL